MAESGCLKDVMAQNAEVANDLRVSGTTNLATGTTMINLLHP